MGGFAAVLTPEADRAPAWLARMIDAAAHRARDGVGIWADGCCHLGVLRDPILPEYDPAAHPCADGRSRLTVVLDGRLDNRRELAASYGWDAPRAAADDPAYAIEAWRRWGEASVERLDGDFVLLAWDAAARSLFVARDRIGPRPVHWTVHQGALLAASDVAQLIAATGTVPRPDEEVAALFLACEPPADGRTLFKGMHRLPAGHVMSVRPGEVPVVREYWKPEPIPSGASRTDEDYAAECRSLLDAAVGARLRARSKIAVFFSGGIDSSAVLAATAHVDPTVIAVSQTFDEPACDERTYQRDLLELLGIRGVKVGADPLSAETFGHQARTRLMLPDSPPDQAGRGLRRAALREGVSVALTGAGGDYIFGGSTLAYADLLRAGRLAAAFRQSSDDWDADATGRVHFGLLRFGVWPLLPVAVRERLRGVARRIARIQGPPPWLRLDHPAPPIVLPPPPGVSWASWTLAREFRDGFTGFIMEQSERSASECGFTERYPLLDARLTSFALSLPEEQRRRGPVTKFVLRRSLAADLPQSIATRTTKAAFGHLFFEAVNALGGDAFFGQLRIAEAGWVDAGTLRRRYHESERLMGARNIDAAGAAMPALWMAIAVELWFRGAYGTGTGDR